MNATDGCLLQGQNPLLPFFPLHGILWIVSCTDLIQLMLCDFKKIRILKNQKIWLNSWILKNFKMVSHRYSIYDAVNHKYTAHKVSPYNITTIAADFSSHDNWGQAVICITRGSTIKLRLARYKMYNFEINEMTTICNLLRGETTAVLTT